MAQIAAVVTNGCDPDPRVIREARWLVEIGHEVTIHAFDRTENLPTSEEIEGVLIRRYRVGKTPYGATIRTWRGIRKFLKKVATQIGDVDLIHLHDADTLNLATKISGTKKLFDMHDLQHTWVRMSAPKSFLRKFISSRMKTSMLRRARTVDAIITSSQGFSDWLEHHGLQSTPVENRLKSMLHPNLPSKNSIGYFGKVRETRSFELLFQAVSLIPEAKRPHIVIGGDGTKIANIKSNATKYPELDIEFIGKFNHQQLPTMMSKISVMFAMYSPERGNINEGAIPSKMFEAAAYGRPSIVNANTPMGDLCKSENLGAAVKWNDIQGLSTAITKLNGTKTELNIDSKRERERFCKVIQELRI